MVDSYNSTVSTHPNINWVRVYFNQTYCKKADITFDYVDLKTKIYLDGVYKGESYFYDDNIDTVD
jgi:hypothetical protein